MFVHILFQKQFQDGGFGDIRTAPAKLIGVFGANKAAIAAAKNVKVDKQKFQYGTGTTSTFIVKKKVL